MAATEQLLASVKDLLASEQWDSAELLSSYLLASTGSASAVQLPLHAEAHELHADALRGRGEQRRAAHFYDLAAHKLKSAVAAAAAVSGSAGAAGGPAADVASSAQLYRVVWKSARCRIACREFGDALKLLEGVPMQHRTLPMHMAIGRLCRQLPHDTLNTRRAVEAFSAALRENAFATEALLALMHLGMSAKDVLRRHAEAATTQAAAQGAAAADASSWLKPLLTAHGHAITHQHDKAAKGFTALAARHGTWAHVHRQLGQAQRVCLNLDAARVAFSMARKLDPLCVGLSDEHAVVLHRLGEAPALNQLVHQMLAVDNHRPEPWVAAAVYSAMRGDDKAKAIGLVEQAIQLDPDHAFAHVTKGSLLLTWGGRDKAEQAVACFRRANELRREFESFKGLVDAYKEVPSFKDALYSAKQALQLNSRNVRAITLVGAVMASSSKEGGHDKAIQAFNKALEYDPTSIDAIMALVDLHLQKGDFRRCIELLKHRLEHKSNQSEVQAKLALVYAQNQQLNEALTCYHQALSFNKYNEDAIKGLARLERQIAGEDTEEDVEEGDEGGGFDDGSEYMQ